MTAELSINSDRLPAALTEQIVSVPLGQLISGRDLNLREELTELEDLTASINDHGVLVPLVVERFGANYRVVAGARRLAASRQAGLTQVPCIVRKYTDDERFEAALIDNIQRNDLTPLEQGKAFAQLGDRGLNYTQIAERVRKSKGWISRCVQLLGLPAEEREAVARGKVTVNEALGYQPQYCKSCGQRMPKGKAKK